MSFVENNNIKIYLTTSEEFSKYLLQENLHLTALEYYYELLERGINIQCLKDFFGNPANFEIFKTNEQNQGALVNCPSLSNLDSIEEEDEINENQHHAEEQIKVLEFELRKRNDEIKGLRERLTAATIGDLNSSVTSQPVSSKNSAESPFTVCYSTTQVHETRALRFLINEHLLNTGCKMTALQFTEECEAEDPQDLDEWNDVGLNCDRPPELYLLLRNNWASPSFSMAPSSHPKILYQTSTNSFEGEHRHRNSTICICQATQTIEDFNSLRQELESVKISLEMLRCYQEATEAELEVSRQQLADLRGRATRLESENLSLTQESLYWRNQLLCLKRDHPDLVGASMAVKPTRLTPLVASQSPAISQELITAEENGILSDAYAINNEERTEANLTDSEVKEDQNMVSGNALLHPARQPIKKTSLTRLNTPEFVQFATEMLASEELEDVSDIETFRLADSLDEIIVVVSSQIQTVLELLPDDKKSVALPLLIQAICLHPDPQVRDRLLRVLFNLFGSEKESESKHSAIILRQCHELATCLGPQRIESELLPQIWSQLNERPSTTLRKLLVSACGVIAPATPSRLRSSLLLSILSQAIEDEKDELVRPASIRSLACVVALMEDVDKLAQLTSTLERIIKKSHGSVVHLKIENSGPRMIVAVEGRQGRQMTGIEAACNWLLPSIAEWCLETDNLWSLLVEPWLNRLKKLCIIQNSSAIPFISTKNKSSVVSQLNANFAVDELKKIMSVLERLVPFIFVHLLQSLGFLPSSSLNTMHRPSIGGYPEESLELEETKAKSDNGDIKNIQQNDPNCSWENLFQPQCILGCEQYEKLVKAYEGILLQENCDEDTSCVELDRNRKEDYDESWPAMNVVQNQLMMPLAQLLRSIQPLTTQRDTSTYLEADPISINDFLNLMPLQFEDQIWSPWQLSPTAGELILCTEACKHVVFIGKVFGSAAIQRYLCLPFNDLLMEKSVQGYFEFDLKALPSAVFAGYCCLLASTNAKSEFNKIKILITNAIFLHARDSCSLHGVRAAIMCLCKTSDANQVTRDILLPALRSCVSCADPSVRRTAGRMFHCLIGYLSQQPDDEVSGTTTTNPLKMHTRNQSVSGKLMSTSLLSECWQLASQLVRDDYASIGTTSNLLISSSSAVMEEDIIDVESVDMACIALALGPLFCLYSRLLRPTVYVTDADLKRMNLFENTQIADHILSLLSKLMFIVGAEDQIPLEASTTLFLIQRPHWETLVTGLLQLANRLFPTCSEEFRDTKILPWLYRMTEVNNMIPELEQRRRLAQRLITVFSTAAFCLGTETPVVSWIMPGLDRLRLDFVEAGEKESAEELEQLSSDLRQRLASQSSASSTPIADLPTELKNKGFKRKLTNFLDTTHQQVSNLTKRG